MESGFVLLAAVPARRGAWKKAAFSFPPGPSRQPKVSQTSHQVSQRREVMWYKTGFPFAALQGACMKPVGFFLLLAGWAIVLAALAVIGSGTPLTAFILSGTGVEILGLGLVIRSHMARRHEDGA